MRKARFHAAVLILELFPDGVGGRAPAFEAVALNHFCLQVDDIDAALAELAAKNVPLTQKKQMVVDRNNQAWIEDLDGNRIELMQMSPDSTQYEAIRRLSPERARTRLGARGA